MNPREVQEACYRAQHEALEGLGRQWRTHREVEQYVNDLIASEAWHDKYPHVDRVLVAQSRSKKWAGAASVKHKVIRISERHESVVLHELAHLVLPAKVGHGREWQETYLELVREHMGFHAYGALQAAYRAEGLLS